MSHNPTVTLLKLFQQLPDGSEVQLGTGAPPTKGDIFHEYLDTWNKDRIPRLLERKLTGRRLQYVDAISPELYEDDAAVREYTDLWLVTWTTSWDLMMHRFREIPSVNVPGAIEILERLLHQLRSGEVEAQTMTMDREVASKDNTVYASGLTSLRLVYVDKAHAERHQRLGGDVLLTPVQDIVSKDF